MHWLSLLLVVVASSAIAEPKESCETLRQHARFSIHFERVELSKLVQTVSDATCKTFIVGDSVKGTISLVGPENTTLSLDADQFYAAFLAALDANGLTVFRQGRFMRIIEKSHARQHPMPLLFEGSAFPAADEVVTKVFKLKFAELEPTRGLLMQLMSPGGDLLSALPDLLIATDLSANLNRLEVLLAQLDVPRTTDLTRLISIRHADAADVAEKVNRLLAPKPGGRPGDTLTLATDERTNRLLVVAPPALLERVETLVQQLDVEVPGDGRARVYRLKNADAKEVATALEGMTQNRGKPGIPQPAATVVGEVRITTNEALNALVIVASAGDYRSLVEVIEQLDVPIRQVFIETAIMEVNVDRDTQLGLSFHGAAGSTQNPVVFGSQPSGAPGSLLLKSLAASSGLLVGLQGPVATQVSKLLGVDVSTFGIALQALQSDSDVNVMSTPYILTTDNKEAEITVGQRVPFQQGTNPQQLQQLLASGNATAASTISSFGSSVTRERVELKLAVKPHIGDGDHIRLEINQSAEEIAGQNDLGPITSTRTQKTTVVAEDAQTLVLGGIMQDRVVESVSKTPLLGDIPLIGSLFRNTMKKKAKVNLLVFLTPHIIHETKDLDRLVQRKLNERRRLLEQLYGDTSASEPEIGIARRPGPLAAMFRALDREQRRPENGGAGGLDDAVIAPTVLMQATAGSKPFRRDP
jgi:general secretion pathway protein D